jgi:DNA-binding transcriptional MerR regulator
VPRQLLAPKTVAARLGLSVGRVAQLDREGVLVAMRDSSNRRLYDPDVVEQFARAREARRGMVGAGA